MLEKSSIIILIGTCAIVVVSVLSYAVFVRPEPVVPVSPPVVNNDVIPPVVPPVIDDDIDTSNWKVYHNEEFGFEIKYPSALYFFDCSKSFHYPLYICFTPYVEDNCNAPWKAKASVVSISAVKDFNKDNIINFLDKNIKEEKIIIGNKSVVQISGEREVMGDERERLSSPSHPIREMVSTIIPFENNISIEIAYSRIVSVSNDASGFYIGEDLSKTYNQILSTFKFTNS